MRPEPTVSSTDAPQSLDTATAAHLNALFFAADANERRLILCNLEIVAPLPVSARRALRARPRSANAWKRRRWRASTRNSRNCSRAALQIPRVQARHILRDDLGEPLVVAAKALGIAREVVYRILLFANPTVGHSVERVHALAALYDEITPQAAQGMVAIWQALDEGERAPATYQPLTDGDRRARARVPPPSRRSRRPRRARANGATRPERNDQPATMSRKFRPSRSSSSTIQTSGSNFTSRAR